MAMLPEDLVVLLRAKAEIETADNKIPISQHIDYMAAAEIERLRDNITRLLSVIGQIERTQQ